MSVSGRVRSRQTIGVSGLFDDRLAPSVIEAFWDAVEREAQEIWLDVTDVTAVGRSGELVVGRLVDAADELQRRLVLGRHLAERCLDVRVTVETVSSADHDRSASHGAVRTRNVTPSAIRGRAAREAIATVGRAVLGAAVPWFPATPGGQRPARSETPRTPGDPPDPMSPEAVTGATGRRRAMGQCAIDRYASTGGQ